MSIVCHQSQGGRLRCWDITGQVTLSMGLYWIQFLSIQQNLLEIVSSWQSKHQVLI